MEEVIALIVPFVALSILSVMVDYFTRWVEKIMHMIPKLPDHLEWWVAYVLVFGVGYFVCWQLDFGLFTYMGLTAKFQPLDYILSALIISGGSSLVRTQFGVLNELPSALQGVNAFFKKPKGGK